MGLKRYLAAVLFVCACKKPPPEVPPAAALAAAAAAEEAPAPAAPAQGAVKTEEAEDGPLVWVTHSGDGSTTLRQGPSGPSRCSLECTLESGESVFKTVGDCMAEKADKRFVAKDCSRTIVMIPAPPRGQKWRQAQVMRVYKKDKLEYPVVGIAALPDEKLMKGSSSWVKGCYGIPGEPPHYATDGNAVEYESIDNKQHSIPLIK